MRHQGNAVALSLVFAVFLTGLTIPSYPGGSVSSYVIVFQPGVDSAAFPISMSARFSHAFDGAVTELTEFEANKLRHDSRIAIVQRDSPVQALLYSGQDVPTGILRVRVNENATARIDGVDERVDADVAILDTGIDLDHPDLNVQPASKFCVEASADDGNGHGTHVAGTIGALDNGIGVVGVAPGARLYAVKVLPSSGYGSLSDVICGLDWVAANNATIDVVNMSIGAAGTDDGNCGLTNGDAFHFAVCSVVNGGVVVVVAAGNANADAATTVPAAYDEVITVAALQDWNGFGKGAGKGEPTCVGSPESSSYEDDRLASFTNWGSDVDVVAPGACILSTYKGKSYNILSGTSMASPHVAGIAALYVASHSVTKDRKGADFVRSEIVRLGYPWDSDIGYTQRTTNATQQLTVPVVNGNGTALPLPPPPPPPPPPIGAMPVVWFTSPANGSVVKGSVSVKISASDSDCGINHFEMYLDSTRIAASSIFAPRCSLSWTLYVNSTRFADGSHTIRAPVWDKDGNVAQATLTLVFDNIPGVSSLEAVRR